MARKKEIEVEVRDGEEVADTEQTPAEDNQEELDTGTVEDETTEDESDKAVAEDAGESLQDKIAGLDDKLLRAAAEFDNYKKRVSRQYGQIESNATGAVLKELLEIVDNFQRALSHTDENTTLESFRDGIRLIFDQIGSLLTKHDVTPIEAIGKQFDPNLHEAMMQVETEEYEEGIVCLEMTRGYRQGDRVLRHSKVGVSSGMAKEGAAGDDEKSKK